jgi:nitrogen fixation-related uncharacterized protein
MAPYIAIALSIGLVALIGIAALGWGIDSRPSYGDDHAR